MIPCSLREIAVILNAKHFGPDIIIRAISINSHVIEKQCMFVALVGKRCDGHDFVKEAVIAGAQALLLNYYIMINVPQLVVLDTYRALMVLAAWIRQKASAKVIAITGSSGKTSVKEMTASILTQCGKVIATKNNYNNVIGVPMTLLRLTEADNFAVVELGSNQPGELIRLSKIVMADVALVNNIYPSHLLGFRTLNTIKKEKGNVFFGVSLYGKAIINAESNALYLWYSMLSGTPIWRFSSLKTMNVDFFATDIIINKCGIRFILHSPYGTIPICLAMLGYHNIANALAASALACSVGANLTEIAIGLSNVIMPPGRLFPIVLGSGKLLLDDTYNSNVGSMIAAIHVLNSMPGFRVLVISDMSELGESQSIKYHSYIGKLITTTSIDYVLTIGHFSYFISEKCKRSKHFLDKIMLVSFLKGIISKCNIFTILVKGSRVFKMEQIVDAIK